MGWWGGGGGVKSVPRLISDNDNYGFLLLNTGRVGGGRGGGLKGDPTAIKSSGAPPPLCEWEEGGGAGIISSKDDIRPAPCAQPATYQQHVICIISCPEGAQGLAVAP